MQAVERRALPRYQVHVNPSSRADLQGDIQGAVALSGRKHTQHHVYGEGAMKCLGWVHLLSIPSAKSSFCLQGKKKGIFIHPATGEQVNLDLDTYKAGKEGCSLKCTLVLGHARAPGDSCHQR